MRLVLEWVTIWESRLLYVFIFFPASQTVRSTSRQTRSELPLTQYLLVHVMLGQELAQNHKLAAWNFLRKVVRPLVFFSVTHVAYSHANVPGIAVHKSWQLGNVYIYDIYQCRSPRLSAESCGAGIMIVVLARNIA